MVALGYLVAATPLLLALLLAGSQLERLARHGEQLVTEGIAVVHLGAQLRFNVNDLERAVRQYAALGDPALPVIIRERLTQAESTLLDIEKLQLTPLGNPVSAAKRELGDLSQLSRDGEHTPESLDGMALRIHALSDEADAISASGRDAISAQAEKLHAASAAARRVMLISSIALLPLTAFLTLVFSVAVTRPLRSLGKAIDDLGNARPRGTISIRFPAEIHRLAEQLDWLRQRLAQLEADKDRFLRHVSHELKTPLASLYEGGKLLQEQSLGPLTSQQQEVAAILVESASELDVLIHNLLAYAQWRQQREQSAMTWLEGKPLIDEVLARQRLSLERRHITIELHLYSQRLYGNRLQLSVALENLMTNAVKHAPPGTSVDIAAGAHDGRCAISVRDRGRGVADEEKRIIFEPFMRGTEAEEAGTRGTGIGLSIVHEAVLLHNGTVEVEDAEPGACFTMAWPCPASGH